MPSAERHSVFEHRHPVDGLVSFSRDRDVIQVDCRWPFDDSVADWIHISTRVTAASLTRCGDMLATGVKARCDGVRGGFVEFAPRGTDTSIEIEDWMGPSPQRLFLILPDTPTQIASRLSGSA